MPAILGYWCARAQFSHGGAASLTRPRSASRAVAGLSRPRRRTQRAKWRRAPQTRPCRVELEAASEHVHQTRGGRYGINRRH
eukprot:719349-Alexandrium_andersonii.AAC.1